MELTNPSSETGAPPTTIELVATAFDTRGREQASRPLQIRFGSGASGPARRHEFLTRLDVEPGRYEIRLAAHDPARNLTGSVFHDLEAPDFTRPGVRLSGLLVSVRGARLPEPRDALADLVAVVPTTRREFGQREDVTAFVRAHQGGGRAPGDVSVHMHVVDAAGEARLDEVRVLAASRFAGGAHGDGTARAR